MMRLKTTVFCLVGVGVLAVLVAACSRSEPTPVPSEPSVTPGVQAQIADRTDVTEARTATPTPVPEAERAVVLEYAIAHRAITEDCDRPTGLSLRTVIGSMRTSTLIERTFQPAMPALPRLRSSGSQVVLSASPCRQGGCLETQ